MQSPDPALIFEQNTDKTRVLVTGNTPGISELLTKIIDFCGKDLDYIFADGHSRSLGSDFLILELNDASTAGNFRPTVVFIATEDSNDDFSGVLRNIVAGGILIYNENDGNVANAVDSSENYFRKLPYAKPETNGNYLKTEIGDIPVNFDPKIMAHIDGARLFCQQFGIMEEDFYEGLASL